jgi:hypothetical protein
VYGWDGGICHRCEKAVKAAGIKNIRVVPVEKPLMREHAVEEVEEIL